MKVVLNAIVTIFVRYLAVLICGFLIQHHIANEEQGSTLSTLLTSPDFIGAVVVALGSVWLAIRSWVKSHKLMLLAIATHGRMTQEQLEKLAKIESPSVTTPSNVVPVPVAVKPAPNEPKE